MNDLGLVGVPRAVRAPLHAGDDPPPRRQDVEVEGQRRRARRQWSSATAPTRCACTSSSWARRGRTRSGRTRDRGTSPASSTACGASDSRSPSAGRTSGRPTVTSPRTAHQTIAKVTDDIERRFQFHTPIAALFELVNEIYRSRTTRRARRASAFATETAVSLIQPYAPHIAEELWERLGHERLWEQPWPVADPAPARAGRRSSSSCRSTARCATASRSRRPLGGRAGRAREGAPASPGPGRRQGDQARDRRPRQARQPRDRVRRSEAPCVEPHRAPRTLRALGGLRPGPCAASALLSWAETVNAPLRGAPSWSRPAEPAAQPLTNRVAAVDDERRADRRPCGGDER